QIGAGHPAGAGRRRQPAQQHEPEEHEIGDAVDQPGHEQVDAIPADGQQQAGGQGDRNRRGDRQVGPGGAVPVDGGGEQVADRGGTADRQAGHAVAPATACRSTSMLIAPSLTSTSTVSPSPTSPASTFSASGFSTSRCTV